MEYDLLDAYCCEGGGSAGYSRARFNVSGVDLFESYTQARYPFPSAKGDAVEYIKEHGHEYDVIVASPPCQRYSITNASRQHEYPDLIGPTRDALIATGKPWVIENVVGAPLLDPLMLCGCMFDLQALDDDGALLHMTRKRLFESNIPLVAPRPCNDSHMDLIGGSYGGSRKQGTTPEERRYNAKHVRKGGYVPSASVQQRLLGIDWMTQKGMHQSIPPVYTEWLGGQLLAYLNR